MYQLCSGELITLAETPAALVSDLGNKGVNNLWNGVFVDVDSIIVYHDIDLAVLQVLVPEVHASSLL